MTDDDVLQNVGPRLRALRTDRGATLTEISTDTGISVSTLSRLEAGGRRPSLELLLPLARVYGVGLDDLIDAPVPADPRVHGHPIVRDDGMVLVPLTGQTGTGLQAYKQLIPPRWQVANTEQRVHDGYEWLYVLAGRIRLLLGARDFVLGAGEVVEFDTRVPHAFSNPFAEPAETLILVGPQGERMHVRARPADR